MTAKQTPIFKRKEIVLKKCEDSAINLGGTEIETVMEVAHVGEQQEYYKVNDKVLVHLTSVKKEKPLKHFGGELFVYDDERYIICKIEDGDI